MDGQLDVAMVSMLEQKFEKSRFTRVDSDVIDNLIIKEDKKNETLEGESKKLSQLLSRANCPKWIKLSSM